MQIGGESPSQIWLTRLVLARCFFVFVDELALTFGRDVIFR